MNTPMIQTTPHTDQQPGDANATATGLAQTTNRPSVTEDTSTPTVIGPVVTPVTGAVSRAVAAQLGTASSLDSATGPSPSDFVASNTVLRAAISGLQREGNGSYTITALLDPPSLGHVEAVIKVDDAGVSVSITAHSPEGHETLASHLDELRHELTSNGREVQLSLANGGDRGRHHEPAEHESAPLENGDENDTTTLTHLPAPTDRSLHLIL
jgi:flagellar hook-length control protein FliK